MYMYVSNSKLLVGSDSYNILCDISRGTRHVPKFKCPRPFPCVLVDRGREKAWYLG